MKPDLWQRIEANILEIDRIRKGDRYWGKDYISDIQAKLLSEFYPDLISELKKYREELDRIKYIKETFSSETLVNTGDIIRRLGEKYKDLGQAHVKLAEECARYREALKKISQNYYEKYDVLKTAPRELLEETIKIDTLIAREALEGQKRKN